MLLLTSRKRFSQPGRKFSAKGLSPFALSATKNWRTNPVKKLSNYSSDDVETIFDNFFENVLRVAPKNFPKISEEIKQKKFLNKVLESFAGIWTSKMQFRQSSWEMLKKYFKSFSAVVPKSLLIYSLLKQKSLKTLCHIHRSFINRDGNLLVKN